MKLSRFPSYKPRADDNLESAKKCRDHILKYWTGKGVDVEVNIVPRPHKLGTVYEIHTAGIPGVK